MSQKAEQTASGPGRPIDVRTIALALDCSTLNRAAVEAAVGLAAATGAQLNAVFIEDECLHNLAAMPFAREISFSGASSRSFSSVQITSEIKRSVDTARKTIARIAARQNIKCGFSVTRGQPAESLNLAGGEAQILALGSSRSRIGRVHTVAALRSKMAHGSGVLVAPADPVLENGPVVAILSPGAEVSAMVKTAERFAAQAHRRHQFLIVSGNGAERAALHQGVLEAQSSSVEIGFCGINQLSQVTRAIRLQSPGLVIADIDYAHLDDASSIEAVSEAFGAPLILVQV